MEYQNGLTGTMNRQLSQQEIDAVFQGHQEVEREEGVAPKTEQFDLRRIDQIPKSQLEAIRLLHDNFVRTLASSVSAYLRNYVTVNLVSVEQLSYAEFLEGLASPTCLVRLGLQPYDGNALIELSPGLIFVMLEILLGGSGKSAASLKRELTDIEESLLDGFLRILLRDLKQAWESVTAIDFSVESLETDRKFIQMPAPGEALVVVGTEMRIGETAGLLNIAIPSLVIKMMRVKFDQQWHGSRKRAGDADQARVFALIQKARLELEARLEGPTLLLGDLLDLKPGDVLWLDFPLERPVACLVNGKPKFHGRIASAGAKKALLLDGCAIP